MDTTHMRIALCVCDSGTFKLWSANGWVIWLNWLAFVVRAYGCFQQLSLSLSLLDWGWWNFAHSLRLCSSTICLAVARRFNDTTTQSEYKRTNVPAPILWALIAMQTWRGLNCVIDTTKTILVKYVIILSGPFVLCSLLILPTEMWFAFYFSSQPSIRVIGFVVHSLWLMLS